MFQILINGKAYDMEFAENKLNSRIAAEIKVVGDLYGIE